MPRCPRCRHSFRVMEDEDDGQHGCPSCGYGDEPRCPECGDPDCDGTCENPEPDTED